MQQERRARLGPHSLDDPRGRQSEALAFEAERARKAGDRPRALDLFAQAAALEYAVARDVPGTEPRVRSVLAISAVALWHEARQYEAAVRAAREFLTLPDMLTEQGRGDLRELLERAVREGALAGLDVTVLGDGEEQGQARLPSRCTSP